MKYLLLFFVSLNLWAQAPKKVELDINHIYIPSGFDSNDFVEVVVSSMLPNLCVKSPQVEVNINNNEIDLKLVAFDYSTQDNSCLEVVVPVTLAVDLGILKAGFYKFNYKKQKSKPAADLVITESNSLDRDDHIYAYVNSVEKVGKNMIRLKGQNPSDCFEFVGVKSITNSKDALSVLPIMKKVSSFCPMKMTDFEIDYKVETKFSDDLVLFHVRTLNGKSVNKVLEIAK